MLIQRFLAAGALLALLPICAIDARAHDGNGHNGGRVADAGPYHIELVTKDRTVEVYVFDAKEKAVSSTEEGVAKVEKMLGIDNLYGGDSPRDYQRKFELPYKPLLDAGVKFYAALGNHDSRNDERVCSSSIWNDFWNDWL